MPERFNSSINDILFMTQYCWIVFVLCKTARFLLSKQKPWDIIYLSEIGRDAAVKLSVSARNGCAGRGETMLKKMIAILLITALLPLCVLAESVTALTAGERAALDRLAGQQDELAAKLMDDNGDIADIYPNLSGQLPAGTDAFPERFDLRDLGVVPAVKQQYPWGTCWAVVSTAAFETSLLSMMGLTVTEYREKFGWDMDLSERHLAWFTGSHLPELSAYPEGEYPWNPSQAGEGEYTPEETQNAVYDAGGNYFLAASALASGIGAVPESFAPYESNQGTDNAWDDWSLPEESRFVRNYELKNSIVLPSPSSWDADGHCVYRPEATAAVKQELLKGRGVAAGYFACTYRPDLSSPEEQHTLLRENLELTPGITREEIEDYYAFQTGDTDPGTLSDDELWRLIEIRCKYAWLEENPYRREELSRDELIHLLKTAFFGQPAEALDRLEEEYENSRFLKFLGEAPDFIWVQYTDQSVKQTHGTCIVGWDDSFPASAFPEGHRPPGDGVWICRNSYSETWGMDGYFYLSYYDMSLCMLQSFEFADSGYARQPVDSGILQYDYMPAEMIVSTLFDTPVSAANVFSAGSEDILLRDVSVLTGNLNAEVTVSVWLLEEGATSPAEGKLLAEAADVFPYAGYHRLSLPEEVPLPAGSVIAIVEQQRIHAENGLKYALVNTASQGEKARASFAERHSGTPLTRWCAGVINPGESYVSLEEGRWLDWRAAVDSFSGKGACACMAYDNLPIKGYTVRDTETEEAQNRQ
jgi:hypothetical protein